MRVKLSLSVAIYPRSAAVLPMLSWLPEISESKQGDGALRALFLGKRAREHVTCFVSAFAYTCLYVCQSGKAAQLWGRNTIPPSLRVVPEPLLGASCS